MNIGNIASSAAQTMTGSGLVGGLLSFIGAKKRQEAANKQNVEFWKMQNAYNHPSEQMKRLREAGLNPNMIYGTSPASAVGNAGDVSAAKAAPADFPVNPSLNNLMVYHDIRKRQAETDLLREQEKVSAQDALLRAQQTAQTAAATESALFKLGVDKELRQTSIDAAKENLRNLMAGTKLRNLEGQLREQGMPYQLADLKLRVEISRATLKGQELKNALDQFETELNQMGLTKGDPWYFRILMSGDPSGRLQTITGKYGLGNPFHWGKGLLLPSNR